MNVKKYITASWVCLFLLQLQAQPYFQKTYKLGDTTSIFSDIYLHDSTYYIGGSVGKGNAHFYTHLLQLDSAGLILNNQRNENVPTNQFYCFSKTDMDTNFRGNLVFGYVVSEYAWANVGQPRISEFDLQGNVIFDHVITDFNADSLIFFTNGTLLNNKADSTYYIAFAYSDERININDVGVLFAKTKFTGEIIWYKKFHFTPLGTGKPHWIMGDLKRISDTTMLLFTQEDLMYNGSAAEQSWSQAHFIKLDLNGNEKAHHIFQDTQDDQPGLSFLPLDDGGVIYAYYDSKLLGTPPNADYFAHRSVITRLNSNFQPVWKDTLHNFYGNYTYYNTPNRLMQWTDSSFLYAYEYLLDLTVSSHEYAPIRIENRHLDGELLWYRDYLYYDTSLLAYGAEYQIHDLAQTPSGDLLFAGQAISYDLQNQSQSFQNAYLLKTNCLGFMGDPAASFYIHDLGNNQVNIVNTSLQAGTFTWDLGDGTLIENDERTDTIFHTYLDNALYPVRLIAKGCSGKADTLDLIWNWVGLDEETSNTYFQVNPNPVSSNELFSVYIGSVNSEKHVLILKDEIGRTVGSYPVPQGDITMSLNPKLAAGTYFVCLMQGDVLLQQEKLIAL